MNDNATSPARQAADFSADIQRSVKKEPLDRVKCVHVFDDFYRCNWWAPLRSGPAAGQTPHWAVLATHYVRKSAFFKATGREGQVVVEEVPAPARADI